MSGFPESFVGPWTDRLRAHRDDQLNDFPNYHIANPETLITTSVPRALYVGTGLSIFTRSLLPAMLNAQHSIHFVTCYWAESPSLNSFRETLLKLASARADMSPGQKPLKITIGFSSSGLFQKLFHTSSRNGHVVPPREWEKMGLPSETALKMGTIELTVKSLFFTPFSVMHPKYLIVDGARCWVPSCNVSWERWFEGCIELEGEVVGQLMRFHDQTWGAHGATELLSVGNRRHSSGTLQPLRNKRGSLHSGGLDMSATQSLKFPATEATPTILLPSSHHRNPRFSLFPFLSQSNPPITPLNAALLTLIENAQRQINIVTPNVTSWPLMEALLASLARGVDVHIRTSRSMMVIEQLVTAGTTTSWCLDRFIKKYKALVNSKPKLNDPEAPALGVGRLDILYYKPLSLRQGRDDEPVFSHFKMTMVDEEFVMFGSGNMDRASWWTSQEIGVLLHAPEFDGQRLWEGVLDNRSEVVFRSADMY